MKMTVVILFADYKSLEGLFIAVRRLKINNFVWVGSDAWGGRDDVLNDYRDVIEGSITVQLNTRELPFFSAHYTNLAPFGAVCQRNPFFCQLHRLCDSSGGCIRHNEKKKAGSQKFHIDNLRDAIYAYVYALKEMHADKCGHAPGVCDAMKPIKGIEMKRYLSNVSFTDPDGTRFQFFGGSDGQPRYTILNVQKTEYGHMWKEVGKYSQEADLKPVLEMEKGDIRYRQDTYFPIQEPCFRKCRPEANEARVSRGDTCCWKCVQCEQWQYPKDQQCANCPLGFAVNPDVFSLEADLGSRNICIPIIPDFLDYRSVFAIPVLVISAVGILTATISAGVLISHSNTPIVKAAGREHMALLFSGIISCYVINFVILWQPSWWSCFIVRFIGVCYAIGNSALLVKIARIYRIFNTKESKRTQKLRYISPKSQVALTLTVVFAELVIIAVWFCFDSPKVMDVFPSRLEHEMVCSDLHDFKLLAGLCYPLMLLFPMAYFAFRTRTCPAAFSEARYTGYGIYLTFINVLTFVLIYIGNNSVQVRVLTVCIGLCLNASVILVTSFLTKVYIVVFRPHKNSKDRIMNKSIRSRRTNSGTASTNGAPCNSCTCKSHLRPSSRNFRRLQSNPELPPSPSITDQNESLNSTKSQPTDIVGSRSFEREAHSME